MLPLEKALRWSLAVPAALGPEAAAQACPARRHGAASLLALGLGLPSAACNHSEPQDWACRSAVLLLIIRKM